MGEGVACKVGDPFDCPSKVELFVFLNEFEDISRGAAGKAFVDAQGGVHIHGWTAVVMERANSQISTISRPFQRNEVLYDLRDIGMGLKLLNDFVRIERHKSNLARKHRQNFDKSIKKESVLDEPDSF